jgi:hypothetical protein
VLHSTDVSCAVRFVPASGSVASASQGTRRSLPGFNVASALLVRRCLAGAARPAARDPCVSLMSRRPRICRRMLASLHLLRHRPPCGACAVCMLGRALPRNNGPIDPVLTRGSLRAGARLGTAELAEAAAAAGRVRPKGKVVVCLRALRRVLLWAFSLVLTGLCSVGHEAPKRR